MVSVALCLSIGRISMYVPGWICLNKYAPFKSFLFAFLSVLIAAPSPLPSSDQFYFFWSVVFVTVVAFAVGFNPAGGYKQSSPSS